jgi:uncharacterized protein YbjT (DUF2867 family)
MPVLVTDAHRPLAQHLVVRLLDEGGEVRAYTSGDASQLRAAGAFVAHGTVDDEGRLEAALADVHTLVHLGGGVLSASPERLRQDVEVVVTAASNAGVRRIVALSLPGASDAADDPIRRANAVAEQVLSAAPIPTVVIRPSLVDTSAIRDVLATSGFGDDVLATPVAPVRSDDLIELLVAFDRARSRADEGHLVVAADGPVTTTIAGYLERVGVGRPGRGSLVGRRLVEDEQRAALREVLRGPWTTDLDREVALDGWIFADLRPRSPGP